MPDLGQRLNLLQCEFHADVVAEAGCQPYRFIPYIQPYEFEALLFSDVQTLISVETGWSQALKTVTSQRGGDFARAH